MVSQRRVTGAATVLSALAAAGCGATVSANNAAPAPERFASCATVRATCTGEAETVVRAFAEGIAGHNGSRFRFAVRSVTEQGSGINVPRGVSVGGGEVRDGSVEACVCARNANVYPQVSYVLFTPDTTGTRAEDVLWASFMQLYAIRGDNEVALSDERPSRAMIESSLAALVERTVTVRVTDLDPALDGRSLFAGLLSAERVVAVERARGEVADGASTLRWFMPGRPSPSERVVLVLDNNGDHRCDVGDSVAAIPLPADQPTVSARGAQWSSRADAVAAACAQLTASGG